MSPASLGLGQHCLCDCCMTVELCLWAMKNKMPHGSHTVWGCSRAMLEHKRLSSLWTVTESDTCGSSLGCPRRWVLTCFRRQSVHPNGCLWMLPKSLLFLQDKGIILFEVNLTLSNGGIKWTFESCNWDLSWTFVSHNYTILKIS